MAKDIYERFRPRDLLLDEDGRFKPDPIPMAPPVGYMKQESMAEIVRRMVRSEHLRLAADAAGLESFDEAEDFDVGDDDPSSPYEEQFDPIDTAIRQELRQAEFKATVTARLNEAAIKAGLKTNGDTSKAGNSRKGTSDTGNERSDSRSQNLPDSEYESSSPGGVPPRNAGAGKAKG